MLTSNAKQFSMLLLTFSGGPLFLMVCQIEQVISCHIGFRNISIKLDLIEVKIEWNFTDNGEENFTWNDEI